MTVRYLMKDGNRGTLDSIVVGYLWKYSYQYSIGMSNVDSNFIKTYKNPTPEVPVADSDTTTQAVTPVWHETVSYLWNCSHISKKYCAKRSLEITRPSNLILSLTCGGGCCLFFIVVECSVQAAAVRTNLIRKYEIKRVGWSQKSLQSSLLRSSRRTRTSIRWGELVNPALLGCF